MVRGDSQYRSGAALGLSFALLAALGCSNPDSRGSDDAGRPSAPHIASAAQPNAGPLEVDWSPVKLDGSFVPPVPDDAALPRVYARSFRTWIFAEPRFDSQRLGYLRVGASAAIKPGVVGKLGCARGWYALNHRGFVCLDDSATLEPGDPVVAAMISIGNGPDLKRKLPYIYGTVRRPGPVYRRVPSASEAAQSEPDLDSRYERWLKAPGENGASYGQQLWVQPGAAVPDPEQAWREHTSEPLPDFLNAKSPPRVVGEATASGNGLVLGTMLPRLGYSILRTYLVNGRRYALTSRFEVVPTDRLRPIQGSDFHGFRIPQEIDFPFAIVRQPGAQLYRYDTAAKKLKIAGPAEYRAAMKLTGKQAFFRGKLHYETAAGNWVSDRDASRLDPVKKMPAWGTNGEKWIDINVTKQTLALYEGTKAVYATLVSTGEAGLSDPKTSTATKRGIYRIHTKHITATMDSDLVGEEFELRDVPYVQYFDSNYALHGAYWHDRFGIPKSHGCINLAPEDARRIFSWTEPHVPSGWHGALLPLKGTVLFVHP